MLTKTDIFKTTRIFNAPRDVVWKAWTQENKFSMWFGPKGSKINIKKFDFKKDGILHMAMEIEQGPVLWAMLVYREIDEPSKLVYVQSFTDEKANIIKSPFGGEWPAELLNTVEFIEKEDQTEIILTCRPVDASEEETQAFIDEMNGMEHGWQESFDKLGNYLLQIG